MTSDASERRAFWLFIGISVLSLVGWHIPIVDMLLYPVRIFVTTIHELGHALTTLLTGGQVVAMTVVPDGGEAAGITVFRGGKAMLIFQMGYLGATVAGCLMMMLAAQERRAKGVLVGLGLLIGITGALFCFGAILIGKFSEGSLSIVATLAMAAVLTTCGIKLSARSAQVLLIFLAVQTAINGLSDVIGLMLMTVGLNPPKMSDAMALQQLTGMPALFWVGFWAVLSVILLALTFKITFGRQLKARSGG
jgi:hypothetical protein